MLFLQHAFPGKGFSVQTWFCVYSSSFTLSHYCAGIFAYCGGCKTTWKVKCGGYKCRWKMGVLWIRSRSRNQWIKQKTTKSTLLGKKYHHNSILTHHIRTYPPQYAKTTTFCKKIPPKIHWREILGLQKNLSQISTISLYDLNLMSCSSYHILLYSHTLSYLVCLFLAT